MRFIRGLWREQYDFLSASSRTPCELAETSMEILESDVETRNPEQRAPVTL